MYIKDIENLHWFMLDGFPEYSQCSDVLEAAVSIFLVITYRWLVLHIMQFFVKRCYTYKLYIFIFVCLRQSENLEPKSPYCVFYTMYHIQCAMYI